MYLGTVVIEFEVFDSFDKCFKLRLSMYNNISVLK